MDLQGKTELGFVLWFVNALCVVSILWRDAVHREQCTGASRLKLVPGGSMK